MLPGHLSNSVWMKNVITGSDYLLSHAIAPSCNVCKCCLSESCMINRPTVKKEVTSTSDLLCLSDKEESHKEPLSQSSQDNFDPYRYGTDLGYQLPLPCLDTETTPILPTFTPTYSDEGESIKKIISQPLTERKKKEVVEGEEGRKKFARFREKKFVCDACDHTFTLKQNVAQHFYLYHHPRLESANRPMRDKVSRYQCTKCDKIFQKLEQARRHEARVHSEQAIMKEKKVFPCDECSKIYPTNSQLRDHKRVLHENIRLYKCELCEMEFGRSGGLRRHVQMVHEQQLYKCPYEDCEHPGYKCSKALTAHIRSKHTFIRPFSCLHCDKSFVRKNDLKVHEQIHSLQSGHDCPQCGNTFKRTIYLVKHLKKCGKTEEKEKK